MIEHDLRWREIPEPPVRKPFRPKLMIQPMGFPTGGGGLRIKLRY